MSIWYIDSTLRDGEQAPGVSFTHDEKMNIASMLNDLRIHEVEAGTPAMGKSEIDIIRDISLAGFDFKTTSWCRAVETDIFAAIKTGSDGVNISFPVSEHHLKSLGKTKAWLFSCFSELASLARDYFEFFAIGLQDASRADYSMLQDFIFYIKNSGVKRIRIADTVGCLNPFSTQHLFTKLISDFPNTEFEFHGHNDLGLATSNSLSAVLSGAKSLSTTINGLGERAGNTSLDEIIIALKYTSGIKSNIDTKRIQEISNYVSRVSGREIPVDKPITGRKVFQHESGIHANSLLKNTQTYQLIDKSDTGRADQLELVYGKHSGTSAIKQFYSDRGYSVKQNIITNILEQVKIQSSIKKDSIKENELMNMYYQLS